MRILNFIRGMFRDNRVRANYDKLEKAIRTKAKFVSDLEFHRSMADFYTSRVLEIDPDNDWWYFADSKQKQYDHQQDLLAYEKRVEEADAEVAAQKLAFESAKKEFDEFYAASNP